MRICIYGGTNLTREFQRFARQLTRHLLKHADVRLLSGGFDHFRNRPKNLSVDRVVMLQAESLLGEEGMAGRFETLLPRRGLDRPSVIRFARGNSEELGGTSQARRFELVRRADAVVTLVGEGNTRTVLELAFALQKPALPIPFTGGDSLRAWRRNEAVIRKRLRLGHSLVRRIQAAPETASISNRLAKETALTLVDAATRHCLVLMPFGEPHDNFYELLKPEIESQGFRPCRLDKDDYAGNIRELFIERFRAASALVIDATGLNPNVMYELGRVHEAGISPFIMRRVTGGSADPWPFYLRAEMTCEVADDEAGHREAIKRIQAFLARSKEGAI